MTKERWGLISAAGGFSGWVVLAVLQVLGHGVGLLESLFLLAPLVVVPLGLRLLFIRDEGKARPAERILSYLQAPAAVLVAASFFLPEGPGAAGLTLPWGILAAITAGDGAIRLWRGGSFELTCYRIGRIYLGVGAAWLFLTRFGATPVGFGEPIVLLTALHFHYAGFAAALFAGAVAGTFGGWRPGLRIAASGVVAGPALLAAGFMTTPLLRMTFAILLAVSLLGLGGFVLAGMGSIRPLPARGLLGISAACMVLAALFVFPYAIGEYLGSKWLLIPRMARTHGVINAIGFILVGHVAWSLALSPAVEATSGPDDDETRMAAPPGRGARRRHSLQATGGDGKLPRPSG